MRWMVTMGAAIAIGLAAACSSEAGEEPTVPDNPVLARIATMTDCAALQGEFDTAMDNVERYPGGDDRRELPFSYARAADERMDELGCYD